METSVTEVPRNRQTLSSTAAACHMDSLPAGAVARSQSRGTQQEVTASGEQGMGIMQQPWESLMKRAANTTCCLVRSNIQRKGSAPAIDKTEEMHQSLGENIVVEMSE